MSDDKRRDKENDMLEQTFDNYEDAVTANTASDATKASDVPKSKGKNDNKIIFIGVGVAAIAILLYNFVLKGPSQPVQQQPQQVAVAQPQPASAPEVKASNPEVSQVQINAPETSSAASAPENFLGGATEQAASQPQVVAVTQPASAPEVKTEVKVETPKQEVKPTVAVEPTVGKDKQQTAIADEVNKMFEGKVSEFRNVLTNVGDRVDNLEKNWEQQKDVNVNVDRRLTALENGKSSNNGGGRTSKPKVVKHVVHVAKKSEAQTKDTSKDDSSKTSSAKTETNILISNKDGKKDEAPTKQEMKSEVPKTSLKIYSIFNGRLWIQKEDNSLLTFTEGDKLPTGEKIIKIDDEKYEVVTDKRTITR